MADTSASARLTYAFAFKLIAEASASARLASAFAFKLIAAACASYCRISAAIRSGEREELAPILEFD
jgi:hypothetical protein